VITLTRTITLALPANRAIGKHVRCAADVLVQCVKTATRNGAWLEARWLEA
jgi:hypothetical protein